MDTVVKSSLEIRWNPEMPIDEVKYMGEPEIPHDLLAGITDLRRRLGADTLILGHSYQRDEVIQFADKAGDSLELSRFAAEADGIRNVVFLGVHFMAEAADMLTPHDIPVILPDLRAGCTMADMAQIDDVEDGWEQLGSVVDISGVIPVTYINSTAAVKAHVGRYGGAICTSSNARKIIQWALEKGDRVFFFPDQHLGRNTSYDLGIPLNEMILWNPEEPLGGNREEEVRNARIILWRGYCSVHQHFTPAHVDYWHNRDSEIKVIVHPECDFEVFRKADLAGSTGFIQRTIREASPGTKWAVGTENNLVARLGNEMKREGKEVYSLAPYACLCSTMFRITPEALYKSLSMLLEGRYNCRIQVEDEIRELSLLALDRMFEITNS